MSYDRCSIGFAEYVRLNPSFPIVPQLWRKKLELGVTHSIGERDTIKAIIAHNASLKIEFGWSFESGLHFQEIMEDAIAEISPRYNDSVGTMITDMCCSWIGFVPHNMYDKEIYKDLSTYGLILYNNEIVDFQVDIINFITNHKIFKQHAILRDDLYRFDVFKKIRTDRHLLEDAYRYYMDSIHYICGVGSIPRDMLEEQIGCHFLREPDLFFELVAFSKLTGEIVD